MGTAVPRARCQVALRAAAGGSCICAAATWLFVKVNTASHGACLEIWVPLDMSRKHFTEFTSHRINTPLDSGEREAQIGPRFWCGAGFCASVGLKCALIELKCAFIL